MKIHNLFININNIIALAGGGGSGGGGGGGSGGGGGGNGILNAHEFILLLIFLLGIVPALCFSYVIQKNNKLYTNRLFKNNGVVFGSIIGIIISLLLGLKNIIYGFICLGGVATYVYVVISDVFKTKNIGLNNNLAPEVLQQAKESDSYWDQEQIISRIKEIFYKFQDDWSNFRFESIKKYTSPKYYSHLKLMLLALKQMNRKNEVQNPKLIQTYLMSIKDDDKNDRFKAFVNGSATDKIIDTSSGFILNSNNLTFTEYWNFARSGNSWNLDGIEQSTAEISQLNQSLLDFALNNKMYYSLDWGRLLLPQRGLLFNKASFINSDINNHVIGEWDGVIVQVYTYIPSLSKKLSNNYLVGQLNVPKNYGGIIIKRAGIWSSLSRAPKNYRKYSFEWADFNKRYNVYATDEEKVTAFELLNPKFMAELYDKNLPINIEVVDNIIYFYCKNNSNNNYESMLVVLKESFDELKR